METITQLKDIICLRYTLFFYYELKTIEKVVEQ